MPEKLQSIQATGTFLIQGYDEIVRSWLKHPWGYACLAGLAVTMWLYRLVTRVLLPLLPFSPQHRFLMNRDHTAFLALLHQAVVWEDCTQFAVVLLVGVLMGWALARKSSLLHTALAALLAVLPWWLLVVVWIDLVLVIRGGRAPVGTICVIVLQCLAELAMPVIGAVLTWVLINRTSAYNRENTVLE